MILGDLPNLWNVLASSIGKSLTRASKATTRLSLHNIFLTTETFSNYCPFCWYLIFELIFVAGFICSASVAAHNGNQWWKWIKVDFCPPHLHPVAPCTLHPSKFDFPSLFNNFILGFIRMKLNGVCSNLPTQHCNHIMLVNLYETLCA